MTDNIDTNTVKSKIHQLDGFINININIVDNYGADCLPYLKYILDHKELGFFLVLAHIPTIYFDSVSWQFLMKSKQLNIYWCFVFYIFIIPYIKVNEFF